MAADARDANAALQAASEPLRASAVSAGDDVVSFALRDAGVLRVESACVRVSPHALRGSAAFVAVRSKLQPPSAEMSLLCVAEELLGAHLDERSPCVLWVIMASGGAQMCVPTGPQAVADSVSLRRESIEVATAADALAAVDALRRIACGVLPSARRVLLVVNPHSGDGFAPIIARTQVIPMLRAAGIACDVRVTRYSRHAEVMGVALALSGGLTADLPAVDAALRAATARATSSNTATVNGEAPAQTGKLNAITAVRELSVGSVVSPRVDTGTTGHAASAFISPSSVASSTPLVADGVTSASCCGSTDSSNSCARGWRALFSHPDTTDPCPLPPAFPVYAKSSPAAFPPAKACPFPYEGIVVMGGDGTVHEIVTGMLEGMRRRIESGAPPLPAVATSDLSPMPSTGRQYSLATAGATARQSSRPASPDASAAAPTAAAPASDGAPPPPPPIHTTHSGRRALAPLASGRNVFTATNDVMMDALTRQLHVNAFLPIAAFASGTSNALALGMGTNSIPAICVVVAKRRLRPLDAVEVANAEGRTRVALCGIGWGVAGAIAADSEAYRPLGRARYAFLKAKHGAAAGLGLVTYRAKLSYSSDTRFRRPFGVSATSTTALPRPDPVQPAPVESSAAQPSASAPLAPSETGTSAVGTAVTATPDDAAAGTTPTSDISVVTPATTADTLIVRPVASPVKTAPVALNRELATSALRGVVVPRDTPLRPPPVKAETTPDAASPARQISLRPAAGEPTSAACVPPSVRGRPESRKRSESAHPELEVCGPNCTLCIKQLLPAALVAHENDALVSGLPPTTEQGAFVTVGIINTVPDARFCHASDGLLDLIIARKGEFINTAGLMFRYVGSTIGVSDQRDSVLYSYVRARSVMLETDADDAHGCNVDGEVFEGPAPFRFCVLPQYLVMYGM